MTDNRPIGIFDSGVGGLTVWQQIAAQHPGESTLYLADSFHCPYGPRGADEIVRLSVAISRFLQAQGCKMIVVACNTASAAALGPLRTEFSIPVVGLEPAIKPAALATQSGHVGVLATEGTLQSSLFNHTRQTFAADISVHTQVAHDLVPLVEAGQLTGPETEATLHRYLRPMLENQVDQLVLGCTHYPFLIPLIEKITRGRMAIHNPADAVARQVGRRLQHNGLTADSVSVAGHRFFTTGRSDGLKRLLTVAGHPTGEADDEIVELVWENGQLSA